MYMPTFSNQFFADNVIRNSGIPYNYNIPTFGNYGYPSPNISQPNDWSNLSFARKFDMVNAGIQTGLGIANLGLGIDAHLMNKKLSKEQLKNYQLKNEQLRQDMDYLASERARFKKTVSNTNKMINSSNNPFKPII